MYNVASHVQLFHSFFYLWSSNKSQKRHREQKAQKFNSIKDLQISLFHCYFLLDASCVVTAAVNGFTINRFDLLCQVRQSLIRVQVLGSLFPKKLCAMGMYKLRFSATLVGICSSSEL